MQSSAALQLLLVLLRLNAVKWHVKEFNIDEITIGRPLLTALGLDVVQNIDTVPEQFDNTVFSEEPAAVDFGRLARLMLQHDAAYTNLPVA
jgi:hypothetical protein